MPLLARDNVPPVLPGPPFTVSAGAVAAVMLVLVPEVLEILSSAPALTVVDDVKAVPLAAKFNESEPAVTDVAPVYVLIPESDNEPAPCLSRPMPAPEMTPRTSPAVP